MFQKKKAQPVLPGLAALRNSTSSNGQIEVEEGPRVAPAIPAPAPAPPASNALKKGSSNSLKRIEVQSPTPEPERPPSVKHEISSALVSSMKKGKTISITDEGATPPSPKPKKKAGFARTGSILKRNNSTASMGSTGESDPEARRMQDLRRAFELFDKDGSGSISASELAEIMRNLGQNPTPQEVKEMVSGFDDNDDGEIDFDEFLSLYSGSISSADDEEFIAWAFESFDKDRSGKLSADEIREVIRCMGDELTEEEVAEIMDHGDMDGDGLLSFQEFTRLIIGD